MGRFFAEHCVDELFLTVAPQIAGRTRETRREGLVAETLFLPGNPLWGELASVKRCRSVLFLRYRFRPADGL
jgi:riboflavin biosynthesis pyrimidine reductase